MNSTSKAAVCAIRKPNGDIVGTGFLAADGLVCTCTHVVRQALGMAGDDETDLVGREATIGFDFAKAEVQGIVKISGAAGTLADDVTLLAIPAARTGSVAAQAWGR